jgi:hypothetical protein
MRAALADPLDPAGHLAALYDRLPTVDFSRDVMGDGSALPLRVLPVPECGWSDLGTPERVAETLAGMPADQRAPAQLMQPGTPVNLASNFQQLADAPWPVERAAANS